MLYLCQKYDPENQISYLFNSDKYVLLKQYSPLGYPLTRLNRYWEVMEWMTWMQSGIGPMQVRFPLTSSLFGLFQK